MNKKTAVTFALIGSICVCGVVIRSSDFTYDKVLIARGHRIQYSQYLNGGIEIHDHDHYLENKMLEDQAYMVLANKLLDDYRSNPDSSLKVEILKISNQHCLTYGLQINSIDSLIILRQTILDTVITID